MARLNNKMKASPKAKDITPKKLAWFWKKPSEVRKGHQDKAKEGGYGDNFKKINKAREEKDKLIDDFLNN
tara:strand:- start:33 stop:242 length:210 start_codon:yes stop_codon:yes gene_type:complete